MSDTCQRRRLDEELVARGLAPTRSRARDLVRLGEVRVDGRPAGKAAMAVGPRAAIEVVSEAGHYVSRGARKLRAGLTGLGLSPAGRACLDVGAATGGFAQVLLEAGARRVYAVENGRGQIDPELAREKRIVSLEGTDARQLDRSLIPEPIGAITADVSFISLTKALPAALALAAPGCWLIALVKPQFELGPGRVPRDGIVKDAANRQAALAGVVDWLQRQAGWRIIGTLASPIHGGDGNEELLLGAVKDD